MKLKLKKYKEQLKDWPQQGHHIMAQYDNEKIIVYQSYRKSIGDFAVKNQYFGEGFSLERMTWVKPNFLWMMYRNGWEQKKIKNVLWQFILKLMLSKDIWKMRFTLHMTINQEFPKNNGKNK